MNELRGEGATPLASSIPNALNRRHVLRFAAASCLGLSRPVIAKDGPKRPSSPRLYFTSQGKTGAIDATPGARPRWLAFNIPAQETWQPGPFLPGGGRAVFLSMEARRDGPGKPFNEYYSQTPTHLWLYDLKSGALEEICKDRQRLAAFVTPALALSDSRILIQVVRGTVGQLYSVNLDGSDLREFTRAGEGMPYGLSLSPDGRRVAFHLATAEGYQVWTSDLDGAARKKVAAHPDHLYFGTSWSPDGEWLVYVDCHYREIPSHDWCDVCIGRPDGTEHRVLTAGQSMWFGATYGSPRNKGGGSNLPAWTRDGRILFPRRLPGSKVPWEHQPNRPDVDHFNRDYKPELARGGTEICRLDPHRGTVDRLTQPGVGQWDFRAVQSPDGKQIAFCRAGTGEAPGLWVMESAAGGRARLLTRGFEDKGADHPRWLPPE